MPTQTCIVSEDIHSYGKDKKVYAVKGTVCNVLHKMDNMWILENPKNGQKFSCNLSKITIKN